METGERHVAGPEFSEFHHLSSDSRQNIPLKLKKLEGEPAGFLTQMDPVG